MELYIKICGRVQGVGYRFWAKRKAHEIGGVSGWVRNVEDGSVEILMSGEEDNVNKMLAACYQGPLFSRVDNIKYMVGQRSGFLPLIEEGIFRQI